MICPVVFSFLAGLHIIVRFKTAGVSYLLSVCVISAGSFVVTCEGVLDLCSKGMKCSSVFTLLNVQWGPELITRPGTILMGGPPLL